MKAFFQQRSYAKPLEETITTQIQEKSKAFSDRARVCFHLRVKDIDNNVLGIGAGVKKIVAPFFNLLLASVQNAECKLLDCAKVEAECLILNRAP